MSSLVVGIEVGRKRLGDLVTAACQGTDVILTRNGKRVGRLVRYRPTIQEILDTLNSYTGDNIWQDVILSDLDVDEQATDRIDVGGSDRFVLEGGPEVRWDQQDRQWRVPHWPGE